MGRFLWDSTRVLAEGRLDEPDNPTDYFKLYLSTCVLCIALYEQPMGNTKSIYPHTA